MGRSIRKLFIALFVAGGIGAAFVVMKRRRDESMPGAASPQWPPLETSPTSATTSATTSSTTASAGTTDWVQSVDGMCPDGYPIKVNANSGIYHVPDGRSYQRTVAQRCYATAAAAERDGYRQAKA
jgi:hypothetical protein